LFYEEIFLRNQDSVDNPILAVDVDGVHEAISVGGSKNFYLKNKKMRRLIMRIQVWKETVRQFPAPIRRLIRLISIVLLGQVIFVLGYGIYRFSVSDHPSKLIMAAAGWLLLIIGIGTLCVILFYPLLSWIWTGKFRMVSLDSDTEDWTLPTVLAAVLCGALGYTVLALQGIGIHWFSRLHDWLNQWESRL
jgi:hypothetical protein